MKQQAPSPPPVTLPASLAANPKLSSWLRFSADGCVTVSPGKVEIGQGIVTALAQIAADELDVDLSRMRMVRASTAASPNEGVTSGSLSVQQSGRALRHACAEVRRIFLGTGVGSAGCRRRCAQDRGRHHFRTAECPDQLLGACGRSAARSERQSAGNGEAASATCPGGTVGSAHRYSRQGIRAAAFHSRLDAPGYAAWPRVAAAEFRALA